MSKVLDKLRKHKKVMAIDDERDIGNSIIVTLNKGWRFDYDSSLYDTEKKACHVLGFDKIGETVEEVKSALPCECEECVGESK